MIPQTAHVFLLYLMYIFVMEIHFHTATKSLLETYPITNQSESGCRAIRPS